jgi:hypothetical protein
MKKLKFETEREGELRRKREEKQAEKLLKKIGKK